jgi:hypothetical protein
MNFDEGLDQENELKYLFDYSKSSGIINYSSNRRNSIEEFNKRRESVSVNEVSEKTGYKETYRNQDSFLHYFVPTTQSEMLLDSYVTNLINCKISFDP